MRTELSVEQLLRWRLARAEAEAPPAPRARELLAQTRPWWELLPEHFHSLAGRVGRMQIVYGHAMAEPGPKRGGYPVPTVIFREGQELETSVCVLYLNVRDGRLRLRFQLDGPPSGTEDAFEVTFVGGDAARPLLSAEGTLSVGNEYRVDVEIAGELAREWESLKVTDRMPFRLILRAAAGG